MPCCGKDRKKFKNRIIEAKAAKPISVPKNVKISVERSQRIRLRQEKIKKRAERIAARQARIAARSSRTSN